MVFIVWLMSWERLQKDALEARKARDTEKANLLTTIISQVKNIAIDDGHRAVNDSDVVKVVRQFLKSVEENLSYAAQGKLPTETVEKLKKEKDILESYLPKQLSAEEIREIIKNSSAKSIGEAMKYLKENYDGQYDGKLASQIAKEVFA